MIAIRSMASALPDRIVTNDEFPGLAGTQSRMFLGSKERRHVARNESSLDLFERAVNQMGNPASLNIDAILTNVSVPDLPFTGCGAMLAQRLEIRPKVVLDLHNGGCVSFILLLDFARSLIKTHGVKNILLCVGQTAAGRIFSHEKNKEKPQSAIPGDGAAVALLSSEGPLVLTELKVNCHPEYSADMTIEFGDGRKYWEPGLEPACIEFSESKMSAIIMRGNRLVPNVMHELLAETSIKPHQIDGLITNQPNPYFLRNWREALQLPESRHFHSFEKYANLFQAGIPINLDEALVAHKIKRGDRILLAGFSHAGDYSAAALLELREDWRDTGTA